MFDLNELDYSKIKLFLLVAIIQILSLVIGFYCGYIYDLERNQALFNYTTKSNVIPSENNQQEEQTSKAKDDCFIKGSKSKIYHIAGGAFYNRTTAQECFDSEEEAIGAGYTKSSM